MILGASILGAEPLGGFLLFDDAFAAAIGKIDFRTFSAVYFLKAGSTARKFYDQIQFDGTAVDLTGATVVFVLKNLSTGVAARLSATIDAPASGLVEYTPSATDVQTSGNYHAEWEVTLASGAVLSFPENRNHHVRILEDLG